MEAFAKGTWVVVADSERAMVLENTGTARDPVLTLIRAETSAELLALADRSARGRDQKQTMTTEPPDYDRLAGETLAADLAQGLAAQARKGSFDRLVIAAAPQVLSALRMAMDDGLRACVIKELPKTLTHHPLPRMADVLAEALAAD